MQEKNLIITKIEEQKRNKNRVSIYINEEYAFGIHIDIALKFNLEKGKRINKEFIEEILKKEEQNKGNNYAIKLLSIRPRSNKEIMDKMKGKGYDQEIIESTLKFLERYDLINDKEFTKEFIKDKSKKYGRKRIEIELNQKGIKDNIINEIINEEMKEGSEYKTALEIGKKRLRAYKNEEKGAIYRKLGSYLGRKGFSYDIISRVLREVIGTRSEI